MGLAASQARLLTITARKSDCEYQSMAYSHQKIALSRDMSIVSAEYQDALTQTKLVYDFYGTGDKSTQLSYGLLMQPSKLNDYMPSPITDQAGRVVLDAKLAAAAAAAGIPQEGLGTTPSSDVRNKFIQGLVDNGVITETVGQGIMNIQYNPEAGLGSIDTIDFVTRTVTYDEFVNEYLCNIEFDFNDLLDDTGGSNLRLKNYANNTTVEDPGSAGAVLTLSQILNGDYAIMGLTWDNKNLGDYGKGGVVDKVGSSSYWDVLFETLASYVDTSNSYVAAALEYAQRETLKKVECLGTGANGEEFDVSNAAHQWTSSHSKDGDINYEINNRGDDYVGFIYCHNKKGNSGKYNHGYALNLTNITKAYFTYFAQYMQGLATTEYEINNEESNCNFVDDDFSFEIIEGADTSGDSVLMASFYDMLFNQIATKGWVQNDQVTDNEYLQTMLQNGSMYISTIGDDNYYYQGNYATNSYIKEITDEEGIAIAEAKYNREKDKINAKENIIDMKMKNLDTEISALTTEYDTVKSVISKNIEKTFKRYDA